MLDYPIVTPENVAFRYTLAGPGTRFVAWTIDVLVLSFLFAILTIVMGIATAILGGYGEALVYISSFLLFTGYWIVLEQAWNGRTVGKRICRLRVVGQKGLRLSFGQVALRNLMRPVDFLPGLGGFAAAMMLLHPEHRRLGDLVAGTLVIRERKVPPPDTIRVLAGRDDSTYRGMLDLPSDLVRRVPAGERDLLIDLAMRRDRLDEAVRMKLFGEVAQHLRESLDLEQARGMSDEKLVLLLTAELLDRLRGPSSRA